MNTTPFVGVDNEGTPVRLSFAQYLKNRRSSIAIVAAAIGVNVHVLEAMANGYQPITAAMVANVGRLLDIDPGDALRFFPSQFMPGLVSEETASRLGTIPFEDRVRIAQTIQPVSAALSASVRTDGRALRSW